MTSTLRDMCRGIGTERKQRGGTEKRFPSRAQLDRIEQRVLAWTTADLARYTATGNPNGRVTPQLNDLIRTLGDDARNPCVWTLAIAEMDPGSFRESAGGLLTKVLRRRVEEKQTRRQRNGQR